jgi:hypothetical protein
MLGDIAFVRVLGPIQVVTISGLALDLPSASQRRLLARLAVDAPRALRVDLLCDVLAVSPGALRTIVSRLRKGFGDTIVVASQGRYRLAAPVDAALFITSLSQAGTADDRIGTLERALALWTGPAFDEFAAEDWAEPEAVRLAELHASAIEDHAVELIVARRWAEAIAELKAHVSVHPLLLSAPFTARKTKEHNQMPSVIGYHHVTDHDHWLSSDLREKKFGELGVTNIRTFIDPTNPARVGASGDVPDLPAFMAWLQSEDGAAAAASDGVLLDTLVFLVES